ncbi:MAG TPA: choice-of-anchor tandem repeat GloVer-containing protein [Rhizomicrobium sp.]|nr:choice-of-anchor tandem repeat GloVer-containing protein [Rhizomicrobium sp.]
MGTYKRFRSLCPYLSILYLLQSLASPAAARHVSEITLHSFCDQRHCEDGSHPNALAVGRDGAIYGATNGPYQGVGGAVFRLTNDGNGWRYSELFNFKGQKFSIPWGGLIIDTAGNLYGVSSDAKHKAVVYKLTPGPEGMPWIPTVLYRFCSKKPGCADGDMPTGLAYHGQSEGLPYDGQSPLFGTTPGGGLNGSGTAFELVFDQRKQRWKEDVIFNFGFNAGETPAPYGVLAIDKNGNLFGTTAEGGAYSNGAAFQLAKVNGVWTETVLHNFCSPNDCLDGLEPLTHMILDREGNLFGASLGGTSSTGQGVLFKIVPSGINSAFYVLHDFCVVDDCADGNIPTGALSLDHEGAVVGTTGDGGTSREGVAFRWKDKYQKVYDFCSQQDCLDGRDPGWGVIQGPGKALLGTTSEGGTTDAGTVFELE